MAKPWEAYRVTPSAGPTTKEADIIAGTKQSEATTAKTLEDAETERQIREFKIREAAATAAIKEREAGKAAGDAADAANAKTTEVGERRARISTALDNLSRLESIVNGSWTGAGTGSIVGQENFRAGDALWGASKFFNQTSNDVAGAVEMVQGDLINQVRKEMEESGAPIGVRGADTEKEATRMAAAIANLAQTQDEPEFLTGVQRARDYYMRRLEALEKQEKSQSGDDDNTPALGEDDPRAVVTDESGSPLSGGWDAGGSPDGGPGGGGGGPSGPSGPDRSGYTEDMSAMLSRYGTGLARGTGDLVEGAGDFAGIALNPVGNLWYKMLGYDKPYDAGTILRETVGLPDNPDSLSSMINKGGSAALTGSLGAKGLAALASPGAMKSALSLVGSQPGRDIAIGGAAASAGELAREGGYGMPVQALASLAGGLGSSAAVNRVAAGAIPKFATPIAQAAQRQSVDLLPADVGGPATGIVTSAARASPISVSPIIASAQKAQGQMGMAAGRAARSQGSVPTTDTAGEWLQQAAKRYSAKTKDIGDTLYKRAFKAAGDVSVPAPSAITKIDDMLKGLRANPETNAGAIGDLIKLRRDLTRGQTAEQMHQLRSEIGQGIFDGNLRSNADKGRMKAIRGALTEDMFGFFDKNFMPGISKGIRRADKYHEDRVKQIDEVLQPIVGKDGFKGGEQVVQAVESMARGGQGGNKRLSRLMSNMTAPERGEIRSTLIDRIGRATPGQQNAEGDAFSPATFLTNWNKMTPQAKATLFGDDGLRSNLDDIAKLAEGTKRSQKMANVSNTSGAMQGSAMLQLGWAIGHLPSYLAGVGAQYVTGRLMASPRFAKWLARAPDASTPATQRKMLDQLGVIAAREPALQQDALALQGHLKDSLTRSPGSVAAEEEEGN